MKKKNTIFGHKNKKRPMVGQPVKIVKKPSLTNVVKVETVSANKLDVVIVSVDYNDYLILTLEHNRKNFENITVVTTKEDELCQKICKKFRVKCVLTDRIYENGSSFNKGKAINDGIKSIENPDFILILDADIIVNKILKLDELEKGVLYTSDRWICFNKFQFDRWKSGDVSLEKIGKYEQNKGYGFFQLFKFDNNNMYPEDYDDASNCDLFFRNTFKSFRKIESEVLHLGEIRKNWKGRKSNNFISEREILDIIDRKPSYKICSYYYNFRADLRQKNNFIKFLEQWKDYYDKLIVGLVDYEDGDIDFEVPCESVIIKGDKENKIWSKEILINKIIDELDTDYIIWTDGDIIYKNLDWLEDLDGIVGNNDFVQLFESINYLGENGEILETHKSLVSAGTKNIDNLLSKGYKPGGSWLAKTSILKEKKLFDQMYVGGGDTIFAYGLFKIETGWTLKKVSESSEYICEAAKKWISGFGQWKVGFLNETINHLYHGDLKERNYNERYHFLQKKEKISIVIPAYKSVSFLEECIQSIIKSRISRITIEILIGIDNCQETLDFVSSNNFIKDNCKIYFFEENSGPYFIRNTLTLISKYDKIVYFDSDDIMCENLLIQTSNYLSEYDCVRWKFMNFFGEIDEQNFELNNWHAHGVFGVNKEAFLQLNGFMNWRIGADSEFLERSIRNNLRIFYTEDIMFFRRQHDDNQTRNKTTGIGTPARLAVQKKLKEMKKNNNFQNPEFLYTKKYRII